MLVARIIRSAVRVIGECICNEIWDEIKDEFGDRGNNVPPLSLRDETLYCSGEIDVEAEGSLDIS